MIRWERLGVLVVPVMMLAALICGVRGAWMFGERWGWISLAGALLVLAYAADRGDRDDQQGVAAQPQELRGQQTQRIGAVR